MITDMEIQKEPAYIIGYRDGWRECEERPLRYAEKLGFWIMWFFWFMVGVVVTSLLHHF